MRRTEEETRSTNTREEVLAAVATQAPTQTLEAREEGTTVEAVKAMDSIEGTDLECPAGSATGLAMVRMDRRTTALPKAKEAQDAEETLR